jgi:hypothetical protein
MADINTDQRYDSVTLSITNAAGGAATVDGVPVWASSDETVITVTAGDDGMTAVIDTVAPGTARVTVTADADLGNGVQELTGVTEEINVTAGPSSQASLMTLNLGAPVEKTAPTPTP